MSVRQKKKQAMASDRGERTDPVLRVLAASGQAVYDWSLKDDRLSWSGDTAGILGCCPATGEAFRDALPAAAERRNEAVHSGTGRDLQFTIEYQILRDGDPHWIEETGVCRHGSDGTLERMSGVVRLVTERKIREAALSYLATYDKLTGHLNRTELTRTLNEAMIRVRHGGEACAYLVAGIDDLWVINETYGFEAADEMIAAVGLRLSQALRPGDAIGRISGNKFGMVLAQCSANEMTGIIDRLGDCVRGTAVTTSAGEIEASVSIGCLHLSEDAGTSQEVMAEAAMALDRARHRGRDAHVVTQASGASERKHVAGIADCVLSAIREGRVKLAYQPIVCTKTGEVAQWECLARILNEEGELIPAASFVPVAEKLGLIRSIDLRVLEGALSRLKEDPKLHLAVNVSSMAAVEISWLSSYLGQIQAERSLAPRLAIEITEHSAIEDLERSCEFIAALRSFGCKIAIDDFGAGYTSFRNLQRLNVDVVKIDGSFIRNIARDKNDQFFVKTLIALARNFDLETVAECVGCARDVAILNEMGVDFLQGFYIGHPEMQPKPPRKRAGLKQSVKVA